MDSSPSIQWLLSKLLQVMRLECSWWGHHSYKSAFGWQVKVRSVGASGAGHSPWSEPVVVTMPGRAEGPPPAPASAASEASEAPKRRRKKGGHERELEQADPKRSESSSLQISSVAVGSCNPVPLLCCCLLTCNFAGFALVASLVGHFSHHCLAAVQRWRRKRWPGSPRSTPSSCCGSGGPTG